MARDSSGAGTVIVAFVLGAVAGAAAALLVAPATGDELRRKLSEHARDGAGKAREVAEQGRDLWNRQRQTINTAIDRGREAYQQARGAQPPGTPGESL